MEELRKAEGGVLALLLAWGEESVPKMFPGSRGAESRRRGAEAEEDRTAVPSSEEDT